MLAAVATGASYDIAAACAAAGVALVKISILVHPVFGSPCHIIKVVGCYMSI